MIETKFKETKIKGLTEKEADGNIVISQLKGTLTWKFSKGNKPIEVNLEVKIPETGQVATDLAVKDFAAVFIQPVLGDLMNAIAKGFEKMGNTLEEVTAIQHMLVTECGLPEDVAWDMINVIAPAAMEGVQKDREKEQGPVKKEEPLGVHNTACSCQSHSKA